MITILNICFIYLIQSASSAKCTQSVSTPSDYDVCGIPLANHAESGYDRKKCKSCCRFIIVSEYNFVKDRAFKDGDDDPYYVMDMEFDNESGLRQSLGGYEQSIYLRQLDMNRDLQTWELLAYKMIGSYTIPSKVHDIRSGSNINNKLIIWTKKPPLDSKTDNQRFVYIHPYEKYLDSSISSLTKHFYLPYSSKVNNHYKCYEAVKDNWYNKLDSSSVWEGNKRLEINNAHQIKLAECKSDEPLQKFTLIYK